MPTKQKSWTHPSLRYCKCIERYGNVCTVVYGRNPQVIKGLKFVPANKTIALEILEKRYYEYLRRTAPRSDLLINRSISVKEVLAEYLNFKRNRISETYLYKLTLILNIIITDDFPIDDSAMLSEIIKNLYSRTDIKTSSKYTYYQRYNNFLSYAVEAGYIDKLPHFPPKPAKEMINIVPFSHSEIDTLIDYFVAHQKKQMALLIKFLSNFGLRISEALNLYYDTSDVPVISYDPENRRSIVTADKIVIDGKRSRFNIPKIREFPVAILPDGERIITEIFNNRSENSKKIFPFIDRRSPSYYLNYACRTCGISRSAGESFHSIRKTAINYWEKELMLPINICSYLAGHDIAVRQKYYSKTPTAEELLLMSKVVKK